MSVKNLQTEIPILRMERFLTTSTVAHPEKQQISNLLNFSSLPAPW